MNRRILRRIFLWLVFGLVVLGCASPVLVTPPPATPGSNPIETIIVQTAVVAQTQTAIVLPPTQTLTATPFPSKTATITPTPTSTVVFLFLTETTSPEDLLTDVAGTDDEETDDEEKDSDFVKPVVVREWACRVISRSPAIGAVIDRGSSFRAIWTVENTGTKTWPIQGVDVVFYNGAGLHEKPYYDIPATVGRGGSVTIVIPLTAPKRQDTFTTRWALKVGDNFFCPLRITIETK